MADEQVPRSSWVLLADRKLARLLRMTRTERGAARFEEVARQEVGGLDHEHARSQPRTANNTQSAAGEEREEREDRRHRAREIAGWVEAQLAKHRPPTLHAFVSRKLHAEVLEQLSPSTRSLVEMVASELTQLDEAQLARHPAFRGRDG